MKRILALAMVCWMSAAAFALPTADAVQAEVQRGNYAQAESMMHEVVVAKPNSAKAHYVYAEILAHNGRFAQAAQESRMAKQIDPELRFTSADKYNAFEQLLEREQRGEKASSMAPSALSPAAHAQAPVAASNSGMPSWVWGVGGAVIVVLLWRLLSARRQAAASVVPYTNPSYGGSAPSYGPGYGGQPPSGGSGMLGTGLAAAGGFAAGMLAEKLWDGHHDRDLSNAAAGGLAPSAFNDAPVRNDAADQLEQRSVDFGTGGDWGGDSSDAGGGGGGSDDW